MFFLTAIETADITKELPLYFWIGFIIVMAVVLIAVNKLLTKLFIPKNDGEEALIWGKFNKKPPKY